MKIRCDNCCYYEIEVEDAGSSFCYRYPPDYKEKDEAEINTQITVYAGDWCGEFRPKQEGVDDRIVGTK